MKRPNHKYTLEWLSDDSWMTLGWLGWLLDDFGMSLGWLWDDLIIIRFIWYFRYSVIALKKHSAEKHEKHLRVCNICQATFESYDKFRQHKTIHKEKKKTMHPCPHCNQEYEIKKSLKRHMLRVRYHSRFLCKLSMKPYTGIPRLVRFQLVRFSI